MNKHVAITLPLILFTISACNKQNTNNTATITITNSKVAENKVITPEEVTLKDNLSSIQEDCLYPYNYLPSLGKQRLLVIPVIVPGYETIDIDNDGKDDKDKVKDDLNKAFFGDDTEYESVSSFYKKSSYGKLNIAGKVTDWFDVTSDSSLGISTVADITIEKTYDVANAAVNFVKKNTHIDLSSYDSNQDGFIDGVWLIYSCHNYRNNGPVTDDYNYWAYTTWGNSDGSYSKPSIYSPAFSLFGWASYDFMYNAYGTSKIDAHTYIHETGHFLGLNDYYSDSAVYNPIGQVDMMDGNIIDHNSFSKMLLGWTKPTIVVGNGKVNLDTMSNENSFIVIPSDDYDGSTDFDPFSEYLVIELYSNDGLNKHDSEIRFEDKVLAPKTTGVRIYHANKTRYYVDYSDYNNPSIKIYEGERIDAEHGIMLPTSNFRSWDSYNEYFGLSIAENLTDELRLIEATNVNTFNYGGYQKESTYFKNGDTFSLAKYGANFFVNENRFDNGELCSAVVEIGGIK